MRSLLSHGTAVRALIAACFILWPALGSYVILGEIRTGSSWPRLTSTVSTDSALGALGIPNPAVQLEGDLRSWKEEANVLFVAPANDPVAMQVYYMVICLAYPRRVAAILCSDKPDSPNTEIYKLLPTDPLEGIVFFNIPPGRWRSAGRQVGPNLYISTHTGTAPWRSFCH